VNERRRARRYGLRNRPFSVKINAAGEGVAMAEASSTGAGQSRGTSGLATALAGEQERWFLWFPVLLGAGVALYFALPAEPHWVVAIAPVVAALAVALVWREGLAAALVPAALLALASGFALAKLRTELTRAPVLERQMNLVELHGYIELVEARTGRGERLTIAVTRLGALAADQRPKRVRVRTNVVVAGLAPGKAVKLRATLAPPAIPALPGDYDFARAAWFAGIGGVGYALSRPEILTDAGPPPLRLRAWAMIERIRQGIGARVRAVLPGETGAIASALITGERGAITQATNDAYRDSGLFHILSISGLHMVIMAGAVFLAVRQLLAAIPVLALRYPIKKWAAGVAMIAALAYLLISGAAFATVRSWLMISLMFIAVMLDRPAIALRNVASAALAILIVYPESVLDVGFQMSFAAVVALVAAYEAIRARAERGDSTFLHRPAMRVALFFGGIVLSTLIAGLAVAPFAAYHFHKTQQFALIANLIAIPTCNLLVMPAALATLVVMPLGLEAWPLFVMGQGIDAMSWVARAVAAMPGAVARVPAIPSAVFALAVVGGLWICLWQARWRWLGLATIAIPAAIAPLLTRPDVLIGRDGQLVAVRQSDRALAATGPRNADFELSRWLEHDGDARIPRALTKGAGYRCDALGCTTTVKGLVVAVAHHPAALGDDCTRAQILVLSFPRPRGCEASGLLIDMFDVRDKGTHALYIASDRIRVQSVAETRGDRPWSATRRRPVPIDRRPAGATAGSRVGAFAAPAELADTDAAPPRPEIEDDEASGVGQD
jgi:competence protein ComEC